MRCFLTFTLAWLASAIPVFRSSTNLSTKLVSPLDALDNTIRLATDADFCVSAVKDTLHFWSPVLAISSCSGADSNSIHFVYSEADFSIRVKSSPQSCVQADRYADFAV